jgi:steroid 5-alpha reductase family enzyme
VKEREVTRSGPYRWVRHPLYLGSGVIGLGFVIAANSVLSAVAVSVYMAVTLRAAIRYEEATLAKRHGEEYLAYRAGTAAPMDRTFSFERVMRNREYRAVIGFGVGVGLLWLRRL